MINVRPITDRFSLDIALAVRRKSSADSRLKSTKIGGQRRPLPLRVLRYASVPGSASHSPTNSGYKCAHMAALANEHLDIWFYCHPAHITSSINSWILSGPAALVQRVALSIGLMAHSVWRPTEICITAFFLQAPPEQSQRGSCSISVPSSQIAANPLKCICSCTTRPGPSLCK